MSFTAKYTSECGDCGQTIKPGQEATFSVGEVVHLHCPKPAKVCPRCFMEMPVTDVCPTCDE